MTMSDLSSLDQILAGGGATAKFEAPGDLYTGEIVDVQIRQVNDYDSGKPAFWDDGRPQEQIVVTIATSESTGPDDDGHRNVYIKGWGDQLKAFRQAAKGLGRNPRQGDQFTATYVGDGERKNPRFNPPKLFQYEVTAGTAGLSNLTGQDNPTPAAAQAQAPAAQAAPAAASAQGPGPQEKAKQLIQLGLDDATIASQLGMDVDVIGILRQNLAA
ncbi:hypothetical protein Bra3105_17855 [Brachybacterium halotolerans subsp. kimchii]|uniref:hypothetical protein n=1 Tax=Brachybacterium halotolerans TaxID=2795215 RepID=UPI001E4E34F3|nr:hypothetical protein [Brachybacterium halotolerans]UEJ82667.1 hypothetical protein Bra3105_17855 [Brachybacterium halotolerans subsp. kimchii]